MTGNESISFLLIFEFFEFFVVNPPSGHKKEDVDRNRD